MAIDTTRQGSKGGDPQYTPELRGVSEERGIVVGIVKANVHGSHMGVIQVFIPEMSTDETDKSQWRTVRYCTPFYSRVESTKGADNQDSYNDTKMPSGIVTPPPDLGTTVLCFFPHGKNVEGYYFACVPDTYMLQTLPEATMVEDFENGTYVGGELNDKKNNPKDIVNWKTQRRPEDYLTQKILKEQGLDRDKVRGLNNSSYMRESPSELVGISSKGRRIDDKGKDFLQKYASALKNPNTSDEKIRAGLLGPTARRKGHSISLDDGDIDGNSNQIRFRTSTGHQLLMNDSEGIIYVGNAKGTTWIELGNQGTLDVYAIDSINFRSKNINFHADENIKFHSTGYTQFVSEQQMHLQSGDDFVISSDGDLGISSKKFSVIASGQMNLSGGATSSIKASGIMSVSGSLVMLQGPSLGSQTPKPVSPQQKLDAKFDSTQGKYVLARDSVVKTTVDRVVSHEPFVSHGEKNVSTGYTGGLAGGGGIGAAFSLISAGMSLSKAFPPGTFSQVGTGADIGLDAFGGSGASISNISGNFVMGPIGSNAAASNLASSTFNAAQNTGFDFGSIGDTFTKISDTIGTKIQTFTDAVGDSIGKYGNSITGTDITSSDFPGLKAFGGSGESISNITGNFAMGSNSPTFDSIASNLGQGSIGNSWASTIGDLANSDLGKLVTDGSGKIVDIAKEVVTQYQNDLPQIQKGLQELSSVANLAGVNTTGFDKLSGFLLEPKIAGFEVTDVVKQIDSGFSIGDLDSIDIQGLNAAVVKVAGSNNITNFVDSTTKTVGKYGFNVNQLIDAGYVRPEAIFNDQMSQSSVWTGKDNVSSLNKFLINAGIQEQIQQQTIASNYQKLIDNGGIRPTDSAKEIISLLTGASKSNTDIATKIRFGDIDVQSIVKNTTGIQDGDNVLSIVKNAMQTGGSASDLVTIFKNKNDTGIEDLSTLKLFQGTLKPGETIENINGVSYVVPAIPKDPYSGRNGGKKRDLDQRISKLTRDQEQLLQDGNADKNIMEQISDKLTELFSERSKL